MNAAFVSALIVGAVCVFALCGCSISYSEGAGLSVIPGLAPSDEVQTATISRIGVNVDAKQMAVNLGYERVQQTRVPGYDAGTYVPSVRATTQVDAESGASVGEVLEVGRYEGERAPLEAAPAPSLWGRIVGSP